MTRSDLPAIARAASKRLGEALRTIEESLKALAPERASLVEQLRYRLYDLETDLLLTLRPRTRFADVRLYVIVTEAACSRPWLEAAELAIQGGADCLQLREKHLDGAELLVRARQLVELCRRHRVLCIVNDRADVAILSGADGVHVGQTDLPARHVRRLVGDGLIVGASTHSLEHARQAQRDGADYIGVGPLFRSPTKPRDFTLGPDAAAEIVRGVSMPTVGIAGVTLDNLDDALRSGVQAIAVTSSVVNAPDVRAAAAELKRRLLLARPRTVSGS
jgi:thiamine-phosphate pyrophosphorylase